MADFFEEFGRMVSDVASDITKKTGSRRLKAMFVR